jgi:hypothetical protein
MPQYWIDCIPIYSEHLIGTREHAEETAYRPLGFGRQRRPANIPSQVDCQIVLAGTWRNFHRYNFERSHISSATTEFTGWNRQGGLPRPAVAVFWHALGRRGKQQ